MARNITILCVLVCLFWFSNAGNIRTYYIQAQEMEWDYTPGLKNGTDPKQDVYYLKTANTIGPVYTKCLYRRYTDDTFSHPHPEDDRSPGSKWEHLGILGPILRGVVGDSIVVHFKNTCSIPASVYCHGVKYRTSEVADHVLPGNTFTYQWYILPRTGPASLDASNIGWPYYSQVDEVGDSNSGLIGVLLIGRDEESCPDGYPADMTKEFVTLFMVVDENKSLYLERNINEKIGIKNENRLHGLINNEDFIESNLKHTINGFGFNTIPGLKMTTSDFARWYVVGFGSEIDIHTAHWHGHTVVSSHMRKSALTVSPGTVQIGDMKPDTPGMWMYHCQSGDHITAGMRGKYVVSGPEKGFE